MAKKRQDENVYTEEDLIETEVEILDVHDHEDIELQMHIGNKEVDIYSEEGLEEQMDHDELAPWEQGFMEGELQAGKIGICETCGKQITEDMEERKESDVNGRKTLYCSKRCLDHAED